MCLLQIHTEKGRMLHPGITVRLEAGHLMPPRLPRVGLLVQFHGSGIAFHHILETILSLLSSQAHCMYV